MPINVLGQDEDYHTMYIEKTCLHPLQEWPLPIGRQGIYIIKLMIGMVRTTLDIPFEIKLRQICLLCRKRLRSLCTSCQKEDTEKKNLRLHGT